MTRTFSYTIVALALSTSLCDGALAAELPKGTQKAMTDLKLDASLLSGLDQELAVPSAWIEGARQEKDVTISGTWEPREFRDVTAPFRERYPFINLKYDRAGTSGRGMQILIALQEGRVLVDVVTAIADAMPHYNSSKALADLRDLPTFKNIAPEYAAADGTYLSHKLSYRCLAYNTDMVKQVDLPKTWDDLVQNPFWRGGKLALTNNPSSWLLGLWAQYGENWGEKFTKSLFEDVRPQRRKEGLTALTALAAAGDFHASLPSPEWVAKRYEAKKAPVSYHCPEPVPVTLSQIAMLQKSPHPNASRVFINWMVSREGQIVQYAASFAVPVHKDLQLPQFVPFQNTIAGKKLSIRDDALLSSELNIKMGEQWDRYWNSASGAKAP